MVVAVEVALGLGLKLALVRLGRPEALKVTEELNPLAGVTVTVELPLLPRAIDRLLGLPDSVKLGPGFTVKTACCVCPPA
jgi:hypothetical protein